MPYEEFFKDCTTMEEGKSLFRKLAMQHHPDLGGDLETMKELNRQWSHFQINFEKETQRARSRKSRAEHGEDPKYKTPADFADFDEKMEAIRQKIEEALNLHLPEDCTIELMGLWVWITGNTFPHRDRLGKKGIGFAFAGEKKAWFYAGVKSKNREKKSLDEIRGMHGSTIFRNEKEENNTKAEALHS